MSHIKHIHKELLERFSDFLWIVLLILMTLKGGTSGACAACKYQRRRCAADCPLAPYFPAEQPKLFQNVHRLFGVRSIVKILESLDETQKPEAMKSIIFQSYIRDRSPVHGCLGITQQLQYMIWLAEEELKVVNSQLQLCRSQQPNGQNENNNHHQMIQELGGNNKQQEDVTSQLNLGMGLNVSNTQSNDVVTPFFSALPVSETQQPPMSYTYSCSEVNNNRYSPPAFNTNSGKEILINNSNVWGGQNRFLYNHNNVGTISNQNASCLEMKSNNSVMAVQSQLLDLQIVSNQHQEEEEEEDAYDEYDEIHQFLEMTDDRQSFVDSKDANASTSAESMKE